MSKENIKLFNEAISEDETLQRKLKAVDEKYKEQGIAQSIVE